VKSPRQVMGALAYLAYVIRERTVEGNVSKEDLTLPEAREVINEYKKKLQSESRKVAATPDDIIGTAALVDLCGSQVNNYYSDPGVNTIKDEQISFEFRHQILLDFFAGIQLEKEWSDLSKQQRLVFVQNPRWWDAIIYMISISDQPSQRMAELEKLQKDIAAGVVTGLVFTAKVVVGKPNKDALEEQVCHIRDALKKYGLLGDQEDMLGLIARWAPLEFSELISDLLHEKSGLSENTRQMLLDWIKTSSLSSSVLILLDAIRIGSLQTKATAQSCILSSIKRFPIGIAESNLLIQLINKSNSFHIVLPIFVALLKESVPFERGAIHNLQTPAKRVLAILGEMQPAVLKKLEEPIDDYIELLDRYFREALAENVLDDDLYHISMANRCLSTYLLG
jgi:hypothetical protein